VTCAFISQKSNGEMFESEKIRYLLEESFEITLTVPITVLVDAIYLLVDAIYRVTNPIHCGTLKSIFYDQEWMRYLSSELKIDGFSIT